MLAYFY